MKTLFEQLGGTYVKAGDYYVPDLVLQKNKHIGKYGMMCRSHLKAHRPMLYKRLQTSGELFDYFADIDRQTTDIKDKLLHEYKLKYGATEQLKADNQMEWVRLMNSIDHQIEEVILREIVYIK